ncbi:putative pumilio/PUF RNA binding protein 3 [Trypanosoma grayi]|uniref:putative pumilio/PUF RNA binding protein 3 n=1 Tax=Trypanosoma grayi TaxID=71804 RepID=UPI0004F4348A|nr:putative pumilio/PUF RNA binding protein 3 [Trypanosoma grayi]KEG10883.1 putative pumilio/PUF RNA binding protein 3 [Trypanosoma grayi]
MWTVHEDEYKSAEFNLAGFLESGVGEGEDKAAKPIGVYTKCSQVFATPSATPADSIPLSSHRHNTNIAWTSTQNPFSSPLPRNLFSHPQAATPSQSSIMRVDAPPFEPSPKSIAATVSYAASSPVGKRGMTPTQMSHVVAPEHLNPQIIMPMDDASGRGKDRSTAQYLEWNNHPVTAYHHPHVAVRAYGSSTTADNLRGTVYETAKDQHGCRFLQRLLGDSNFDREIARVIMNEIVPHVAELMTDQYANFLVQKLFDIMPPDVRYDVARVAAPHITVIALTPHGTFSVQKMIETIATREEMNILREALSKDVVQLVKDAHGNHVIQKVLQRFNHADKDFIYTAVAGDCVSIAKNKQGCCVLQRCLEYASDSQRETLVKHILGCCLQIAEDPFGNYVLQYVLESNNSKTTDTIAIAFLPHLVQLCMNKFSSNVMEKVLRGASQPVQEMYVETMCSPDVVARLIQDDFGNYVLQTALTICSIAQAETLVSVVRPLMPTIRNAPYAKKLEGKIESIVHRITNSRHAVVEGDSNRQLELHRQECDAVSPHRDWYHGREPRAAAHQQLSS